MSSPSRVVEQQHESGVNVGDKNIDGTIALEVFNR
jgi:hypothetical protein